MGVVGVEEGVEENEAEEEEDDANTQNDRDRVCKYSLH